ncbi:MAG: zinc ribbon domain-containing protein [Acidobacteriia bacterium]|nr:zinc ribbon domain-containing protein [Terriglobia bacterium]
MNSKSSNSPTSFKEELKIIPKTAWWVIALILLAWYGLALPAIVRTVPIRPDGAWGLGGERIGITVVMSIFGLIPGLWISLVFYVNQDAKRRFMNRVAWTLIVLFIPYGIGFVVYFVARKPIPQSCPQCHAPVGNDFAFCPVCKQELKSHCPNCNRLLEAGWMNCAYCGNALGK